MDGITWYEGVLFLVLLFGVPIAIVAFVVWAVVTIWRDPARGARSRRS